MKSLWTIASVLTISFATIGCDVDVNDPGKLPDVDVTATEGRMPDVDVRTPEITTGEKQVTVPTLDVDIPEENENEPLSN